MTLFINDFIAFTSFHRVGFFVIMIAPHHDIVPLVLAPDMGCSSSVRKETSSASYHDLFSAPRDFADLQPILVRDLKWFDVARGHCLQGEIVVRPMLLTAIQLVLRDESGEQYNCTTKRPTVCSCTPFFAVQLYPVGRFVVHAFGVGCL